MLGNGQGGLGAPLLSGLSSLSQRRIAAADFNEDGKTDLITWNASVGGMRIYLGDGKGGIVTTPLIGTSEASALFATDLDADGHVDVAVGLRISGTVQIFRGNGQGALSASRIWGGGGGLRDLAVADFDRDGQMDVAVAAESGVMVLRTADSSRFPAGLITLAKDTAAALVADFDNSGNPDLALAHASANQSAIYLNNWSGFLVNSDNVGSGLGPCALGAADLTGDGKLDLIVAQGASNNIGVFPGSTPGGFSAGFTRTTGTSPGALVTGDFNRDGAPDVAVANEGSASVTVFLNGKGTLDQGTSIRVGRAPTALSLGDIDRDGALDLAVACADSGSVFLLLGNGRGQFAGGRELPIGTTHRAATLADLDGDGRLDLVAGENGALLVFSGDGDGGFGAPRRHVVDIYSTVILWLQAADLDGDRIPDVLAGLRNSHGISVMLSDGSGGFRAQVPVVTPAEPGAAAIADLDGDARPDLVVPSPGGTQFIRNLSQ